MTEKNLKMAKMREIDARATIATLEKEKAFIQTMILEVAQVNPSACNGRMLKTLRQQLKDVDESLAIFRKDGA